MIEKKKNGRITEAVNSDITQYITPAVETDGTETEIRLGMTIKLAEEYEMARIDVTVRLPGKKDRADELVLECEETAKRHLRRIVQEVRAKSAPAV